MFALLNSFDQDRYEYVINKLCNIGLNFADNCEFHCDYEQAILNVAFIYFKIVKPCFFHFTKFIFEYIRDLKYKHAIMRKRINSNISKSGTNVIT